MKIEAKPTADLIGINVKRNKSHDGREAFVDLEIGVKESEAHQYGEDFRDLAFSSMRTVLDEEDACQKVVHLQDTIKPGSRVVHEHHVVVIHGHEIRAQPELTSIRTLDGEAKVVAKYRIPIEVAEKQLLTDLVQRVGDLVNVEFSPVPNPQMSMFPPEEKSGKSAVARLEDAREVVRRRQDSPQA